MASHSLTFSDLAQYFHLPITDVSVELGICATVLKKICRRVGIQRWPHRKIKSVDRMIQLLESSEPKTPEEQAKVKKEIESLQRKREMIMAGPLPSRQERSKYTKKKLISNNDKPYHKMNLRYLDGASSDSQDDTLSSYDSYSQSTNLFHQQSPPWFTNNTLHRSSSYNRQDDSYYYSSSTPSLSSSSSSSPTSSFNDATSDKLLPIISATEKDYHIFFPTTSSPSSTNSSPLQDDSGSNLSDDEPHMQRNTSYDTVVTVSSSDPLVERFANYDPRSNYFHQHITNPTTSNIMMKKDDQEKESSNNPVRLAKIWDEAELILNLSQPKLPIIEPDLCRPPWGIEDNNKPNRITATVISVGPPRSK